MSGTFNVPLYGLDRWDKLFGHRQQLLFVTLEELVNESYSKIIHDLETNNQWSEIESIGNL